MRWAKFPTNIQILDSSFRAVSTLIFAISYSGMSLLEFLGNNDGLTNLGEISKIAAVYAQSQNADEVAVLEDGQIVDIWRHTSE